MKQEFHKESRRGKPRVWTIELDGKFIHTTHGELGGKLQTVTDEGKVKNAGRSNELSAEDDAANMVERAIRKKRREGYVLAGEASACADFDWKSAPYPESLRFYKPDNQLTRTLLDKINNGTALLGRKREGEMMPLVINDQGLLDVYSRRMHPTMHREPDIPWVTRFPHWARELQSTPDIPPNSCLLTEAVADPNLDDEGYVGSVVRSKTGTALSLQDYRPLFSYVWDIAVWDGKELLTNTTYRQRLELIWSLFGTSWTGESWFLPIDVYEATDIAREFRDLPGDRPVTTIYDMAVALAQHRKWEGWVAIDPRGKFGDRGLNFRGKPDRPGKHSGKIKPPHEDDFVAFWEPEAGVGAWGNGSNRGLVGSIALYQFDEAGEMHFISNCGSGIDDEFRRLYSDADQYPICVQVQYTKRSYKKSEGKSNAVIQPRLIRVRQDKDIDECINPRL